MLLCGCIMYHFHEFYLGKPVSFSPALIKLTARMYMYISAHIHIILATVISKCFPNYVHVAYAFHSVAHNRKFCVIRAHWILLQDYDAAKYQF